VPRNYVYFEYCAVEYYGGKILFNAMKCVLKPRVLHPLFRAGVGLKSAGSGLTLRARAFAGQAWPGLAWGRAWGLACGLSSKTRPAQARAFGLCSKSPSPHCRLGPGPALAYPYFLRLLDFGFLWSQQALEIKNNSKQLKRFTAALD
jgi:hypothetical protein